MRSLVLLVASALAACGPSSAEIRTAKLATYRGDADQMFEIAQATAAETYKIGDVDREGRQFMTEMQWYNPEGGRESPGSEDYVQLVDRSVQVGLIVEVVAPTEERIVVVVTPKTFQHISGSPKPRELAPDDPGLPPWITGRAESLQLEIYKRLKQFEVK